MKVSVNKLVRDKVPDIIKADGGKPTFRVLNSKEYLNELFKKIIEESQEFFTFKDDSQKLTYEIADVLEIIDTIANIYGIDKKDLQAAKEKKSKQRGVYKNMIFLESVEK
jgi:predicted house-cleaning noncanonical NTP pyrophosphatase (MazG superfamily)